MSHVIVILFLLAAVNWAPCMSHCIVSFSYLLNQELGGFTFKELYRHTPEVLRLHNGHLER